MLTSMIGRSKWCSVDEVRFPTTLLLLRVQAFFYVSKDCNAIEMMMIKPGLVDNNIRDLAARTCWKGFFDGRNSMLVWSRGRKNNRSEGEKTQGSWTLDWGSTSWSTCVLVALCKSIRRLLVDVLLDISVLHFALLNARGVNSLLVFSFCSFVVPHHSTEHSYSWYLSKLLE